MDPSWAHGGILHALSWIHCGPLVVPCMDQSMDPSWTQGRQGGTKHGSIIDLTLIHRWIHDGSIVDPCRYTMLGFMHGSTIDPLWLSGDTICMDVSINPSWTHCDAMHGSIIDSSWTHGCILYRSIMDSSSTRGGTLHGSIMDPL